MSLVPIIYVPTPGFFHPHLGKQCDTRSENAHFGTGPAARCGVYHFGAWLEQGKKGKTCPTKDSIRTAGQNNMFRGLSSLFAPITALTGSLLEGFVPEIYKAYRARSEKNGGQVCVVGNSRRSKFVFLVFGIVKSRKRRKRSPPANRSTRPQDQPRSMPSQRVFSQGHVLGNLAQCPVIECSREAMC